MIGIVVKVEKKEGFGEAELPDYWVTIRGESGVELKVSAIERAVSVVK